MAGTQSTTSENSNSSSVSWDSGRTDSGQPVQREIGDTAHSGRDGTYDRDAITTDPTREYDQNQMGSYWDPNDVPNGKRGVFHRMSMWNDGANPSYEHPDGDESGGSAVQPCDDSGRRALSHKLATVELVCDELGVPSAVRSDARTLAAGVDGTGHCLEKVALGAVLVADDRFHAREVARMNVDGPLSQAIERLQGDVTAREIDTILNLLEDTDGHERVHAALDSRLKRSEAAAEMATVTRVDDDGAEIEISFKLNDAKAIYYGGETDG